MNNQKDFIDPSAEVKNLVLASGADIVGIADPYKLAEVSGKKNPFSVMESTKSVITFGICMPKEIMECVPESKYQIMLTNHFGKLRRIAKKIGSWLEEKGYNSYPCHDQDNIEHKKAAQLAGLGRVGSHTLLITPQYGPRVHLNSVLTDYPLNFDRFLEEELCDQCDECIAKCPPGALKKGFEVDRRKCLIYRGSELKRSYCGLCMKICWDHLGCP